MKYAILRVIIGQGVLWDQCFMDSRSVLWKLASVSGCLKVFAGFLVVMAAVVKGMESLKKEMKTVTGLLFNVSGYH